MKSHIEILDFLYPCLKRNNKLPKFIIPAVIIIILLILFFILGCDKKPVWASEIKLSKHFTSSEFSCHHCGFTKVNFELIIKLEELRKLCGNRPIVITSGYRCSIHNKEVGGVANSQHLYGNAVDIKIKGLTPQQVAEKAKEVGFTFVKIYPTFTHIDIRYKKLAKGE